MECDLGHQIYVVNMFPSGPPPPAHLREEQPLGLQLQRHAVPHVVHELVEAEELDGAQRPPVAPVDVDLKLAVALQVDAKPAGEK